LEVWWPLRLLPTIWLSSFGRLQILATCGRVVIRVLGQRPNSRGSTHQVQPLDPNTPKKEIGSGKGQRKEIYYTAQAHSRKRQRKHFSPFSGYRQEF
jgi:hypothetical protein